MLFLLLKLPLQQYLIYCRHCHVADASPSLCNDDNGGNKLSIVEAAISAAKTAQASWQLLTAYQRYDLMMAWHDLIMSNKQDLALLMTLEQGKPLAESMGEIAYGASYIKWFAEEAKRIYGDTIPSLNANQSIKVIKQPVGVVAAITPWNFPNAMLARKIAPTIAAGNTIVAKPSEDTPLSALALGELAKRAGIPAGVINIIVGTDSKSIGELFSRHKDINKLTFTGSTRVGKLLMEQSASTLKRLSMELGGNAPFIVFEDADIAAAVDGAIQAKFRNSGQTCVCANRFLIHDSIYDSFVSRFVEKVKQLKVGNGLEEGVHLGPLIHPQAKTKVLELVTKSIKQGAKVLYDGHSSKHHTILHPIVLTDVTNDMDIAQLEIFGPVAAIQKFETEQQAIALANDTQYGLAAYFYSQNLSRVERVSTSLAFGMVGINEGIISNAAAPFGGIKESGFGREGSYLGLDDYLNIKYLCTRF